MSKDNRHIAPGKGQTTPWGPKMYVNMNFQTLCSSTVSLPINEFRTICPIQMYGRRKEGQGQPRVVIQLTLSLSHGCSMPSFKIMDVLVPKEKTLKGVYQTWAWRPSLSCDLKH